MVCSPAPVRIPILRPLNVPFVAPFLERAIKRCLTKLIAMSATLLFIGNLTPAVQVLLWTRPKFLKAIAGRMAAAVAINPVAL